MHTSHKALAALSVAALFALPMAGCGDDDKKKDDKADTSAETTGDAGGNALSQEEFVAQANAACKKANDEINAAAEQTFGPNTSSADVKAFLTDTAVPKSESLLAELKAITPPADKKAAYDEVLSAGTEATNTAKEIAADPDKLDEFISNENDPFSGVKDASKKAGLAECAK